MAVQKQDGLHTDVAESGVDLTGKEFYFAAKGSDGKLALCGNDGRIDGVISEGRDVGYHTTINTRGNPILKVIAGSSIALNAEVGCDGNGKAKTGSTNPFGYARNAAAEGEMVEIASYPTT